MNKNNFGELVQIYNGFFSNLQFEDAYSVAKKLVSEFVDRPSSFICFVRASICLGRTQEALEAVDYSLCLFNQNTKILTQAFNVYYDLGVCEKALLCSEMLCDLTPGHEKPLRLKIRALLALRKIDDAEAAINQLPNNNFKKKELNNFDSILKLMRDFPSIYHVWLNNKYNVSSLKLTNEIAECRYNDSFSVIQYWSQDDIPSDVRFVTQKWNSLLTGAGFKSIDIYNRKSAMQWIGKHAPEFLKSFVNSFHYAMESDVFRIAYASRNQCIYIDIDSWPTFDTISLIRHAVDNNTSMLYMRTGRPWIANGFFVMMPECAFLKSLVKQCASLKLDDFKKCRNSIDLTFGPMRYNKVFEDVFNVSEFNVFSPEGLQGCSKIETSNASILIASESVLSFVKPPFMLSYKATEDYWKNYNAS